MTSTFFGESRKLLPQKLALGNIFFLAAKSWFRSAIWTSIPTLFILCSICNTRSLMHETALFPGFMAAFVV